MCQDSKKKRVLISLFLFSLVFKELERSNKLVDQNFQKLKVESDRLEEMNKRRCSWTIWIMLAIVCVVFINMIIFIKFFPKKRGY